MKQESSMVKDSLKSSGLLEVFNEVESLFPEKSIYLVGGALRDAFLDKKINDLDFSTPLRPEEVLKLLEGQKIRTQGIEFGTVTLNIDGFEVEITTYRCDETYENHRKPESLVFGGSKIEDLERRDFTINAMMFSSLEGLYDPLGGLKDLKAKKLKAVGDPDKRFSEDALRIPRLFRFNLNYGFEIDEETLSAAIKLSPLIKMLSRERVVSEFKKTFSKPVYCAKLNDLFELFFSIKDLNLSGYRKIDIFEQVLILKKVPIDIKQYLYEKKYKNLHTLFFKLDESSSLKSYKSLLLSYVKKNSLNEVEVESLWSVLKSIDDCHSKLIKSFKIKAVDKETIDKIKALHSGKALGEALFEEELKKCFVLYD